MLFGLVFGIKVFAELELVASGSASVQSKFMEIVIRLGKKGKKKRQKRHRKPTVGQTTNPFLSDTFKLWILGIIFFFIFFYLYTIVRYPASEVLSSETLLSMVLALLGYIWVQEVRDRYRLQALNSALIGTRHKRERAEIDIITVLILAEEAKDPYMRGHSKRVAQCALAIAEEMGFTKKRQRIIERAAILHDLGKLGIMDNLLNKTDKLNDEEWKSIKKHSQRSVDLLKPLKFLYAEKKIIRHHHERYDGTGYPAGLKGEEIPIEARILAVADTFDAMNSERPYRKAFQRDAILAELKKVSGSQLDSPVTSVFLKLLEKNPSLWKRD